MDCVQLLELRGAGIKCPIEKNPFGRKQYFQLFIRSKYNHSLLPYRLVHADELFTVESLSIRIRDIEIGRFW